MAFEILIRIDPNGIILLFLSAWMFVDSFRVFLSRIRNGHAPACPSELHLQVGIALWAFSLGWLLLLSLVRRELGVLGHGAWWFLDSWRYVFLKALVLVGTIEVVAGLTMEKYGNKGWIAALVVMVLMMATPWPGDAFLWLLLTIIEPIY